MRTAPVALVGLGDDKTLVALANEVSALTHADPLAKEACALWCIAIDRAVREGRLDGVLDGIELLDPGSREVWRKRTNEARDRKLSEFNPNGFVVTAFQAALAVVWQTPVPDDMPCRHLQDALHAAIRIGHDTDTVAAIAGSLLGARWGATAVPAEWKAMLHGWLGYRAGDLVRLAVLSARHGQSDRAGWPGATDLSGYYRRNWPAPALAVPLEEDPGVVLANVHGVGRASADVVVSLCRVGSAVPEANVRVEVGLVDEDDAGANPNLDFILVDLARTLLKWRDEGKKVVVHCVQAERRTPIVAAAYLAERLGISGAEAWARVARQLPTARRNPSFDAALRSRWPGPTPGGP